MVNKRKYVKLRRKYDDYVFVCECYREVGGDCGGGLVFMRLLLLLFLLLLLWCRFMFFGSCCVFFIIWMCWVWRWFGSVVMWKLSMGVVMFIFCFGIFCFFNGIYVIFLSLGFWVWGRVYCYVVLVFVFIEIVKNFVGLRGRIIGCVRGWLSVGWS